MVTEYSGLVWGKD